MVPAGVLSSVRNEDRKREAWEISRVGEQSVNGRAYVAAVGEWFVDALDLVGVWDVGLERGWVARG